jgi:hypothetical protein
MLNVAICFIQDWDEDVHGSMDTNANRRRNPQGFVWSCCGENGATSTGCCDQDHGSTLEELYPSSDESDDDEGNESSQNEDGSDENDGNVSAEGSDEDAKRDGLHSGELQIDIEGGLWTVSCYLGRGLYVASVKLSSLL